MCGRLACSLCRDDIPKACGITDRTSKQVEPKWLDDSEYVYKPFYNGPPTTTIPVVIYNTKSSLEHENYFLVPMKWGFTPPGMIPPNIQHHTHNARVESVATSNLYKNSLSSEGRCIIVAEGFYEWQTTAGAGNKQPYFFYQEPKVPKESDEDTKGTNKYLMKMAGLWTSRQTDNGVQYSCTMLTMESDKTLSWLHHRMPVILNTPKEINDWLDHERVRYDIILPKITKPFLDRTQDEFKLKSYTVDKNYANKSTCNDPKCMVQVTVKRPNTLDNWLTAKKKK